MKNEISERSETGDGRGPVPPSTLLDRTDLILAVIIFAVCGFLFFLTTRFEEASKQMSQNIPPEWFPQLLLVFIMALTLIIPFEHLFMGKKVLGKERQKAIKPISIFTAALLCGIILLMPWLGTFVTMIVVCALMPLLWGERRLKILVSFAIVFPGLVAFLFTKILRVYFEAGIWERLF